jgi:hypothetical protein
MKKSICFLLLFMVGFGYAQGQATQPTTDFRVTKGRIFTALTFSLDQRLAENEDQLLRYVINQDRLNYTIRGGAGYALQDNLTVGVGFGYGRQREEITYEDENGQPITAKSLEQGVSIVPNMRAFIPLGNGRIQIIVQTELGLTFSESLQRNFYTDNIDKIEGKSFEGRLGISPGALIFFDRNWSFETTVGLAGLATRIEEQMVNNDESNKTRIVQTDIDLRLNLLQLNLGIAYYF